MKLACAVLALLFALTISATAAYFSVAGLGALFAAAFWPVVVMGSVLEGGKLVAASWLHANWSNARLGLLHKSYLTLAVAALMIVTALGIYGYLAKGHLEQSAPIAGVAVQMARIEAQITDRQDEAARLNARLRQLDDTIAAFLRNDRATQSLQAQTQQKAERAALARRIDTANAAAEAFAGQLVPLRLAVGAVEAKLGPVRYVADLFGMTDPETAVRMIILLIMFAFDPLAVALVLSASLSFAELAEQRRQRRAVPPAPATSPGPAVQPQPALAAAPEDGLAAPTIAEMIDAHLHPGDEPAEPTGPPTPAAPKPGRKRAGVFPRLRSAARLPPNPVAETVNGWLHAEAAAEKTLDADGIPHNPVRSLLDGWTGDTAAPVTSPPPPPPPTPTRHGWLDDRFLGRDK